MGYFCDLPDGRRIPYTLQRRERDPFYLACFRGPDRKRKELTTKAANLKRAQLAAVAKIRIAYGVVDRPFVEWDEAIEKLNLACEAANLRPGTVDQYRVSIRNLRKVFPESMGPADITADDAAKFVKERTTAGKSPRTIAGNVTNLSIVFGRWFRDACKIIDADPFAEIEPPKLDKPAVRIIAADEDQAFRDWLAKRWPGWRLPLLFLDVKAAIGCRIGELASLPTAGLQNGRLVFQAADTKGRKQRAPMLPAALFKELKRVAGPTYAFERFADELKEHSDAYRVKEYKPLRLMRWLQRQARTYFETTDAKRFKLHNYRGSAMSKARLLGVPYDDAAIAFGCNPETMRKHYVATDEQAISDSVFAVLNSGEVAEKGKAKKR